MIVDNFYNSSPIVLKRLEAITGKPVPFHEADVCDARAMDTVFAAHEFDAIIHFAGYKAVGESVQKPLAYYRNNLDSTLTLCEMMQKHGVNALCVFLVRHGVRPEPARRRWRKPCRLAASTPTAGRR